MSAMNARLTESTNHERSKEAMNGNCHETDEHLTRAAREQFERDVLAGLTGQQKTLPCKYFYDARGSALFEEICETPEYYVTRTETALLRKVCPDVARRVGPELDVLEPGSGAGEKIRILLDALERPHSFSPIDISPAALHASVATLKRDYPDVEFHPLVADFTASFILPARFSAPAANGARRRRMIFFPGSTISNFTPGDAAPFLAGLRRVLDPGDFLFIGVDRVKDARVLQRAYDDARGATARFNLNLLERMRRELDTNIDPRTFRHRAIYDARLHRIEMHLVSIEDQIVSVCGRRISFRRGESIHTENSYKYSPEAFVALADCAGYRVEETYSDEHGLFSLYLCTVFG